MDKHELSDKKVESLVREIVKTYQSDSGINFIDATNLPVRDKIIEILDMLTELLFLPKRVELIEFKSLLMVLRLRINSHS